MAREPQPAASLTLPDSAVSEAARTNMKTEDQTSPESAAEAESQPQEDKKILWESLKQQLLNHLSQRSDDKALEKLLEALEVESRAEGFCFVCSNKAEHTLLLEKLPKLQELVNRLMPAPGNKLTATVKEVPAALTKPKPAKPAEIREAMAEKNPVLLKFIEQLKLKLD